MDERARLSPQRRAEDKVQEEAFRAWLGKRDITGKLTRNSITHRMAAVRGVDRRLGDLDAAFRVDKLAGIMAKLTYTDADAIAGKTPPEIAGRSGNPVRYLGNLRAYVRNYRQFLDQQTSAAASWSPDDDEALSADQDQPLTRPARSHPLNQILYGPPGTGKTYRTAQIAVEICNGAAPADRDELMDAYADLRRANRIAFTTFHPSMGYEEFVEGLRPSTEDENGEPLAAGGFRLAPRNGIFREIAALAEQARTQGPMASALDFNGRNVYKMSLGRAATEPEIYNEAIAGDYIVLGWGGTVDWSDPKYHQHADVLNRWRQIEPDVAGNSGNVVQVWRFRSMSPGDLVIISHGNHRFRAVAEVVGDYEFHPDAAGWSHRRAVRWLAVLPEPLSVDLVYEDQFSQQSCYLLRQDRVKREGLAQFVRTKAAAAPTAAERYVLIIDEINRANVSKVLGELITLLEPDKRLGQPNQLTLRLPYSNHEWGVPDNLYLVGTMNTADRSIALLDTALRRRFDFVEMLPDYEALRGRSVEGVPLDRLLEAINARIEWLFDRDHQIGHALFTTVQNKADLDAVMLCKVGPLLAEYFYEDWEKIRAVLNDSGEHFVKVTPLRQPRLWSEQPEPRVRYSFAVGNIPLEAYQHCLET